MDSRGELIFTSWVSNQIEDEHETLAPTLMSNLGQGSREKHSSDPILSQDPETPSYVISGQRRRTEVKRSDIGEISSGPDVRSGPRIGREVSRDVENAKVLPLLNFLQYVDICYMIFTLKNICYILICDVICK